MAVPMFSAAMKTSVPPGVSRREKTVAGLMNRQFASHQVSLGRQNISVLPDARDLARALELAQALRNATFPAARQPELAGDVGLAERTVVLSAPAGPEFVLECYVRSKPCKRNNTATFIDLTRFQSEVE
jgi:hypothetical protein